MSSGQVEELISEPVVSRHREYTLFGVSIACVVTTFLFYLGFCGYDIATRDAYTFYELSRTIPDDFYRSVTHRQFENLNPYSTAFPLLWPTLVAASRIGIKDLGLYNPYILNMGVALLLLWSLLRLARKLELPVWVGCLCYLLLLGFSNFRVELVSTNGAALSIPLLVLLVTEWHGMKSLRLSHALILGGLAGLLALNRFDSYLAGGSLGVIVALTRGSGQTKLIHRLLFCCVYYGVFFLVLSPWMIYCQKHFGKPFASDNLRQVLTWDGGHVADYYPKTATIRTLKNDPVGWGVGFVKIKFRRTIQNLVLSQLQSPSWLLSVILVLLTPYISHEISFPRPYHERRYLLGVAIYLASFMIPYMMTGYAELRYFVPHVLFAIIVQILLLWICLKHQQWGIGRVAFLLLLPAILILAEASRPYSKRIFQPRIDPAMFGPTEQEAAWARAAQADSAGKPYRILIVPPEEQMRFGAVTGASSIVRPRLKGPLQSFVADFEITHVLDVDGEIVDQKQDSLRFTPLTPKGLYRIEKIVN